MESVWEPGDKSIVPWAVELKEPADCCGKGKISFPLSGPGCMLCSLLTPALVAGPDYNLFLLTGIVCNCLSYCRSSFLPVKWIVLVKTRIFIILEIEKGKHDFLSVPDAKSYLCLFIPSLVVLQAHSTSGCWAGTTCFHCSSHLFQVWCLARCSPNHFNLID